MGQRKHTVKRASDRVHLLLAAGHGAGKLGAAEYSRNEAQIDYGKPRWAMGAVLGAQIWPVLADHVAANSSSTRRSTPPRPRVTDGALFALAPLERQRKAAPGLASSVRTRRVQHVDARAHPEMGVMKMPENVTGPT